MSVRVRFPSEAPKNPLRDYSERVFIFVSFNVLTFVWAQRKTLLEVYKKHSHLTDSQLTVFFKY